MWADKTLRTIKILLAVSLPGCSSMEALVDVPEISTAEVQSYNLALHDRSIHLFDPIDLTPKVFELELQPRVSNLFILLDQSAQMDDQFRGISKKMYAQEIVRRLLRTLPTSTFSGGLWVLDETTKSESPRLGILDKTSVLTRLNNNDLYAIADSATLSHAIDKFSQLMVEQVGRSALVIVTAWERLSTDDKEAVMRLRQQHTYLSGEHIGGSVSDWNGVDGVGACVYLLGVGNRLSRTLLDETDSCGFSMAADKVAQPQDMAHFVEKVLYVGPADEDGDGIFNYRDECPNTTIGRIVNSRGCIRFPASNIEGVENAKSN